MATDEQKQIESDEHRKKWGDVSKEKLDALKAQYKNVWVLNGVKPTVVFRRASRLEYNSFQSQIADNQKHLSIESEKLASSVVVHPSYDAFQEMLEERPGLAGKIAAEVRKIAADEMVEHSKKYETESTPQ